MGGVGEVVVSARRHRKELDVTVVDEGKGLPAEFAPERGGKLGLQIVRALVTGELRGTIDLRAREERGTHAEIVVPLTKR